MKKCFLIVILIIKSISVQSQDSSLVETNPKVKETLNSCEFIFKGKVIKMDTLHTGDKVFDLYTIDIEKIYRGGEKIKKGTVMLVNQDYSGSSVNLGRQSYLGQNGRFVLLCKNAKESLPNSVKLHSDNYYNLEYDNQFWFFYSMDPLFKKNDALWSSWGKVFRYDYQFNKYIKQFSNIDTLTNQVKLNTGKVK